MNIIGGWAMCHEQSCGGLTGCQKRLRGEDDLRYPRSIITFQLQTTSITTNKLSWSTIAVVKAQLASTSRGPKSASYLPGNYEVHPPSTHVDEQKLVRLHSLLRPSSLTARAINYDYRYVCVPRLYNVACKLNHCYKCCIDGNHAKLEN